MRNKGRMDIKENNVKVMENAYEQCQVNSGVSPEGQWYEHV